MLNNFDLEGFIHSRDKAYQRTNRGIIFPGFYFCHCGSGHMSFLGQFSLGEANFFVSLLAK